MSYFLNNKVQSHHDYFAMCLDYHLASVNVVKNGLRFASATDIIALKATADLISQANNEIDFNIRVAAVLQDGKVLSALRNMKAFLQKATGAIRDKKNKIRRTTAELRNQIKAAESDKQDTKELN